MGLYDFPTAQQSSHRVKLSFPVTVPPISTSTTVAASGEGHKIVVIPRTIFTPDQLGGGVLFEEDFVTFWEGELDIDINASAIVNLEARLTHFFPEAGEDISFNSSRVFRLKMGSNEEVTIALNAFNSITDLHRGPMTTRDGTSLNLTKEIMTGNVGIEYNLFITFFSVSNPSNRLARNIDILKGLNMAVHFRQPYPRDY